jgi:hypothetical protein
MKITKFEKRFVNSPRRSQRVAECAEKMLRTVGFRPGQSYLDFGCGNGAAAIHLASKLGRYGLWVANCYFAIRNIVRAGAGLERVEPAVADFMRSRRITSSAGVGTCLFCRIIQDSRDRHDPDTFSSVRARWIMLRLEASPFFEVFVPTGTKYPYVL